MNEDLTQLKADIAEFEAFKETLDRQQLTFPLDKRSLDVVHTDIPVPTGNVGYPSNGTGYGTKDFEFTVNNQRYLTRAK